MGAALGRRRRAPTLNASSAYLVTMLLSGLWHGAGWNYIAWGGLHGLWLALHRLWIDRLGRKPRLPHWARWVGAFHTTSATLVVFRAPTLTEAGELFAAIAALRPATGPLPAGALALVLLGLASHLLGPRIDLHRRWIEAPQVVQGLVYGTAILLITVLSGQSEPFIYFHF